MRRLLFTVLCVFLLSTAAFAQTSPSTGGLVVFETFGLGATQAGVQPGVITTQAVLFATVSGRLSRNLGVAIVNPQSTSTNVTLTLRNGVDGTVISAKVIPVGAGQQISKFISELYSDVSTIPTDFDGSIGVTSTTPIAIVGLRFRGLVFSTIPITSPTASTPVPQMSAGVGGATAEGHTGGSIRRNSGSDCRWCRVQPIINFPEVGVGTGSPRSLMLCSCRSSRPMTYGRRRWSS